MIKQVLFDFGGVFVDIQFRQLMEKITGDAALAEHFFGRMYAEGTPWFKYDQGLYDSEETYRQMLRWVPEIRPEHMRQFMEEWPKWLPPFPEMENIIPDLHAVGCKCYLLSNFPHRFEECRQYCPGLKDLDGQLISFDINMLKPDRKIFDFSAAYYGIDPAETLFIDDNLQNIESARAAGYQVYRFTDAEDLRTTLKNMHILPK